MRARFALVLLFVSLGSLLAIAQDDIPTKVTDQNRSGEMPFSTSIGTQIEHVDVGSAALNIVVPIVKFPGRNGMDFEFSLHWNSNQYMMAPRTDGQGNPFYIWTMEQYSGWQANQTQHSYISKILNCTLPVKGTWVAYTNYIYTDPTGTKHPVIDQAASGAQGSCVGPGDATGPDLTEQGMLSSNSQNRGSFAVLNSDGSKEDLQDSNGNQKTTGTDTLGRNPCTFVWTNNNLTEQVTCADSSGTAQTYTINWQTVNVTTSFGSGGTCGYGSAVDITGGATRNVVSSIVLPNQQQYVFKYDTGWAEVNEIDLPTGGAITYQWGTVAWDCRLTRRYVTSRIEWPNGVTNGGVCPTGSSSCSTWTFDLSTSHVDKITYPAVGSPAINNQSTFTTGAPSSLGDGAITDAKIYAGSAQGTPLREYQMGYASDHDPLSDEGCYSDVFPPPDDNAQPVNQRVTRITTILENNLQKKIEFDYDSFTYTYHYNHCDTYALNNTAGTYTGSRGNVTEIREFDWGSGAPGPLLRRTDKTYLHNSNSTYLTYNIVDKVLQDTIYDATANTCVGVSQPCAQTQYEFDNYVSGVNALISTGGNQAPQHDYTNYSSSFIYRGNVTRVKRYPSTATGATPLTTIYAYDDLGNLRAVQDPAGNSRSFSYLDNWSGSSCPVLSGYNSQAYLTLVTDAKGYQTNRILYPCTGLLEARQDQNDLNAGRTGTLFTYDWAGRPTSKQDTHLTTDTSWGTTTNTYNDVPPITVTTSTKITTSLSKTTITTKDGLGRVTSGQLTTDPDGTTETDSGYDALSRIVTATNPYRPGQTLSTDGTTTSVYDALSRVTSANEPDGSSVSTSYSGNCTTATDEAGKARQSCSDGLGRLTKVLEDPGSSPHLNYETDYVSDVLGNLLKVTQMGDSPADSSKWRVRTFTYDAMSRLNSAANPESGSINYYYTKSDGTLCAGDVAAVCRKTEPQQNQTGTATVTISYAYDQLNRMTGINYTANIGFTTPPVSYGYDGIALSGCTNSPPTLADSNPIHQRTAMCDGSGATSWAHDQMGRIAKENRKIKAVTTSTKMTTYTYNLDGSVSRLSYPGTNRGYTYTVGGAGRPTAVKDGGSINYVTSATYAPFGGLSGMVNGSATGFSGINTANSYNKRLQPIQMYVTTATISSATLSQLQSLPCPTVAATMMSRSYNFAAGTTDNGNVQSITNCLNSNRTQSFTFDALNRILTAQSSGTDSNSWGEDYTGNTDAWSNLTKINPITQKANHEGLNCGPANTKNQLNTCYSYDAAGNLVQNGSINYTYDAENRLVWSSNGYEYLYDGDGERVIKCTAGTQSNTCPSGSTGTLYWGTIAESSLSGTNLEEYIFFNGKRVARRDVSTNVVHYYFSDHLGSHAIVENATGSACEQDIDYYPYGGVEHDFCTTPVAQNYKFTGKERDAESGLDNFGARYYASNVGRFMTPDWAARPTAVPYAVLGDPQSLNLYTYVRNDPISSVDPDGHGMNDAPSRSAGAPGAASQGDIMSAVSADTAHWNNIQTLCDQGFAPALRYMAQLQAQTHTSAQNSGGAQGAVQQQNGAAAQGAGQAGGQQGYKIKN